MIQFASWEVGVILTVRRGTPATLAEAQMGFECWPVQFDPCQLAPYGPDDEQSARDSFALLPALCAKMQGEADWERFIPADVRLRQLAKQRAQRQASEMHELEQVLLESAKLDSMTMQQLWQSGGQMLGGIGGGWGARCDGYEYDGADDEDDDVDADEGCGGRSAQTMWQLENGPELQAAMLASLQDEARRSEQEAAQMEQAIAASMADGSTPSGVFAMGASDTNARSAAQRQHSRKRSAASAGGGGSDVIDLT